MRVKVIVTAMCILCALQQVVNAQSFYTYSRTVAWQGTGWTEDSSRTKYSRNAMGQVLRRVSYRYGASADSFGLETHQYNAAGIDTCYKIYIRSNGRWILNYLNRFNVNAAGAITAEHYYSRLTDSTLGFFSKKEYELDTAGRVLQIIAYGINAGVAIPSDKIRYHYIGATGPAYDTVYSYRYTTYTPSGRFYFIARRVLKWRDFFATQDSLTLLQRYDTATSQWINTSKVQTNWLSGNSKDQYTYQATWGGRFYLSEKFVNRESDSATQSISMKYDTAASRLDTQEIIYRTNDANNNLDTYREYTFYGNGHRNFSAGYRYVTTHAGPDQHVTRIICFRSYNDITYIPYWRDDFDDFVTEAKPPIARLLWAYPNPTGGVCRIKLPVPVANGYATMHDAAGRVVAAQSFFGMQAEFDLHTLSPGMYTVHLEGDGKAYQARLERE